MNRPYGILTIVCAVTALLIGSCYAGLTDSSTRGDHWLLIPIVLFAIAAAFFYTRRDRPMR